MCIVLFTTAHPAYSLIVIDNRDEYILRPTSRPAWWKHPTTGDDVLSARDLQRTDKGTWFGISRTGVLAVLTNYREKVDANHLAKSRGRVVTAWLASSDEGGLEGRVRRLVQGNGGGLVGVGGFSLVGGRLRKRDGGIAIVSNRARQTHDVPIINLRQRDTWALSNTVFDDPNEWPKVKDGKRLLAEAMAEAAASNEDEKTLLDRLFGVLDTDTLPQRDPQWSLEDYINRLRHTIFVPAIGDETHLAATRQAMARGRSDWTAVEDLAAEQRPEPIPAEEAASAFATGMYGTQRQTVLLVDWDGDVTFVERALWDRNGHEIPRGEGDVLRAIVDMADKNKRRPTISAPLGPVESSRGYNLVRSQDFAVVAGIDDCEDKTSYLFQKTAAVTVVSAGPSQSTTTTTTTAAASASASASASSSSSRFLRRPSFPSSKSSLKSLLPTSKTTTRLQLPPPPPPPPLPRLPIVQPPLPPPSKLPKSRTINVLNDLKKSISRTSLTARSTNAVPPPSFPASHPRIPISSEAFRQQRTAVSPQGKQHSPASKTMLPPPIPSPFKPQQPPMPPKPPSLSRAGAVRISKRQKDPKTASSLAPRTDTRGTRVVTAQPLAYWTGRFSRLSDMQLATPETLPAVRARFAAQKHPRSISEDDARHLHILQQLASLCATPDAKRSLREFQIALARRFDRHVLLPPDDDDDDDDDDENDDNDVNVIAAPPQADHQQDRGLVARFFGKPDGADSARSREVGGSHGARRPLTPSLTVPSPK
ncbi:hypothetical protein L249_2616 [Ophiocordyceps polyrhachis-furcata BCC 54312]|uniref:Uncharacterized protein n=1 Tax=Ophiocordyceps polyrhachis-furcata BCC 54312 TaxID=1330021 RepID=A0A367LS86_9HYPO|nr:hypothetical protein L249_2616 [Ophiocordyceps polyrhachis-furcata BCC 54312]